MNKSQNQTIYKINETEAMFILYWIALPADGDYDDYALGGERKHFIHAHAIGQFQTSLSSNQ